MLVALAVTRGLCQGVEPAVADSLGDVPALLTQLESDRCDVRDRAARQLTELASRPELADRLAVELRQALAETATFESRSRLTPILAGLPDSAPPAPKFDPTVLDRLVEQLEDESYGVRQTAAERLAWSLGDPDAVCPTMIVLREKLADPRARGGSATRTRTAVEKGPRRVAGERSGDLAASAGDGRTNQGLDRGSNQGRAGRLRASRSTRRTPRRDASWSTVWRATSWFLASKSC